jgi:cytidine diphosphoramidate kinase
MSVYWITGLSGAGKTTIGHEYYLYLKSTLNNVIFLDGDELREIMGGDFGYEVYERKRLAYCYARISKMLSDQGNHVVIATISMFNEVREWNRDNIENYFEIYIKVPIEILIQRDQKNIYSNKDKNVIGINIQMEEPLNSDIVILNDGKKSPQELAEKMYSDLNIKDKQLK